MDPLNVQHSTLGVFWSPNFAQMPPVQICDCIINKLSVVMAVSQRYRYRLRNCREQFSIAIGTEEESNGLSSRERAHPVPKQGLLQWEWPMVECLKHPTANHKVAGSSPTMTDFLSFLGVDPALLGVYWCLYRKVAWQNVPGLSPKRLKWIDLAPLTYGT